MDERGESLEKHSEEVARNAAETLLKIKTDTASVHRMLGWLYAAVLAVGMLFAVLEDSGQSSSVWFLFILLVPASVHLLAATGLERHKVWGRPVSIAIGLFLLPGFPIGSFLGIYILFQMFRKEWKLAE